MSFHVDHENVLVSQTDRWTQNWHSWHYTGCEGTFLNAQASSIITGLWQTISDTVNQLNFAARKFRGFRPFWAIIGDFTYIILFNWYATAKFKRSRNLVDLQYSSSSFWFGLHQPWTMYTTTGSKSLGYHYNSQIKCIFLSKSAFIIPFPALINKIY